ncbi:DNA sulfur modification protein DndE [Metapseudomonas otitidis]|uniref:DNA sulfur modification protein DndE n=1 Tax=Metapseudomonas otitidis TaxID=319939 RepID=UPI00280C38AA|nr:DNA sulfur modification protein DndE [Pseudomonas otitidis]
MIDRIRLTAAAKNQLSVLKRRTGIEHYNSLCRHAFCVSISNPSPLPEEMMNFSGGLEIDFRVLVGGNEELYINLLAVREGVSLHDISPNELKDLFCSHVHRGLSYMFSKGDEVWSE